MQRKWMIVNNIAWICILVFVVTSTNVLSADVSPPNADIPSENIMSLETASLAMDAEFSYQGVLKDQGVPVNGVRNFKFQIHNDTTCTSQLQEIIMSSVPVVDGRFHVTLLVKHEYFNGQKLYLQVVLGTSTRLMCEEILAVPYALSVMPGAEIKNTVSEVTLNNFESVVGKTTAIGVDATASGGLINYGVRGSIDSTTGAGVYAYAEAATSRALFARNNQGGTAAYLYGNLTQNVEGYGVVKAGVLVFCGDPSGTERQFGPNTITNSGIGTGVCELDFGFDLSNRFWQVSTPNTTVPRFVSCLVKETDNNVLQCTRWTSTGSQISGEIMVLIY